MPKPVIVCIGTDKISGDALGPLVGDFLVEIYDIDAFVYGKSRSNVNGVNFSAYHAHIQSHHSDSMIIAIDSCLGIKADVGKIKVTASGVRAGGALGKNNQRIGDIGILAVVGEYGQDNFNILRNIDKIFVQDLAFSVAAKVHSLLQNIKENASFIELAKNTFLAYDMC